jgi:hypothetical protein
MLGSWWWKGCREDVQKLMERLELGSANVTERGHISWVEERMVQLQISNRG